MTAEDLTVPLHTVPVGARVVYGEKLWEHYPCQHSSSPCIRQPYAALCWASMPSSTPVLWLDGDAPVPLAECEGWFWDPHPDHGRGVPARWTAINGNVADLTAPDGGCWTQHARALVWPIHRPEPALDDTQPEPRWTAREHRDDEDVFHFVVSSDGATSYETDCRDSAIDLARHLNETEWPGGGVPAEPERAEDGYQFLADLGCGDRAVIQVACEGEGYAVVDLHAITDAIAWLRAWVSDHDRLTATQVDYAATDALLDALGVGGSSDA